ncbi:hypothetical protein Sxan_07010 [Streptomyces xanthophaeus]|uniref:Uncharacterized protein n=1 Tax=Streptomyces xanthophaeus TaxID=67385 RepID=A0A919GSJ8_9ACTN|nr:hypothetical protein Sxan_07010 [Streptomyces xanthophaeus]
MDWEVHPLRVLHSIRFSADLTRPGLLLVTDSIRNSMVKGKQIPTPPGWAPAGQGPVRAGKVKE